MPTAAKTNYTYYTPNRRIDLDDDYTPNTNTSYRSPNKFNHKTNDNSYGDG